MLRIAQYIISMSPYMAIAIPVFVLLRFIYIKFIIKTIKTNILRETAFLLFVAFLTGLASLTIMPKIIFDGSGAIKLAGYGRAGVNFIPFLIFIQTYKMAILKGDINYFTINFLGNIVMFMPIGFCSALLWNKINLQKAALFGFFTSLFIEICQLFIARGTDIDDLLLNTLGAVIGFLSYKALNNVYPKVTNKFKAERI